MITVQAVINNVTKTFTLNNLSSVKSRQDLGHDGVEDMTSGIDLDLNEASVLWNLRIRYDNANIYTYIGNSLLVSVNPYRTLDPGFYGLDAVSKYESSAIQYAQPEQDDGNVSTARRQQQEQPPPHIFAVGAAAYKGLVTRDGQNQVGFCSST